MAPHNRLGLDYAAPLPPPPVPIVDAHLHIHEAAGASRLLEAAGRHGVCDFVSMTPLEKVEEVRAAAKGRVSFIAIPDWQGLRQGKADVFGRDWLRRIDAFADLGARIAKFHAAPRGREKHGIRLDHPGLRAAMARAAERGLDFLIHVADPDLWFASRYKDAAFYGTKEEQYDLLRGALDAFPGRTVILAHLGGSPEDFGRLDRLLDAYPRLHLDTSAAKWMIREVSARTQAARDFLIRRADRILFGSDNVTAAEHPWELYASRYHALRKLWESDCDGESPIEDPDLPKEAVPRLKGLALPRGTLERIYRGTAEALGLVAKSPIPAPGT